MDKPFTLQETMDDLGTTINGHKTIILRCDYYGSAAHYEGATITDTEVTINIDKDKLIG